MSAWEQMQTQYFRDMYDRWKEAWPAEQEEEGEENDE